MEDLEGSWNKPPTDKRGGKGSCLPEVRAGKGKLAPEMGRKKCGFDIWALYHANNNHGV